MFAVQDEPDRERRKLAIGLIAQVVSEGKDPASLARLVHSMQHDPDPSLRVQAISCVPFARIADFGNPLMSMTTDQALEVRREAAKSLLMILVNFMQNEHDPTLRSRAMASNSQSLTAQVLDSVIRLAGDPATEVRMQVAKSLGHFFFAEAIPAHIALLHDHDPEIVVMACSRLDKAYIMFAEETLFTLLASTDERIARAAWNALWSETNHRMRAKLGQISVATVLAWHMGAVERSAKETSGSYGRFDQQALAWDAKGVASLVVALSSEQAEKRILASRALAVSSIGEAMPYYFPQDPGSLLFTDYREDRKSLMDEARSQGVDVQAALLKACGDEEEMVRLFAVIGLRGDDSDPVREVAFRACDDRSRYVAFHAAMTLAASHDERAYDPLIRVIDHSDDDQMRQLAIYGLGLIGGQRINERLVALLSEGDQRPGRLQAAIVLGDTGDVRVVPLLIAALESEPYHSAISLGKLGDWRATPALIKCLENPDIRQAAALALCRLRDPRAADRLIELLAAPDEEGGFLSELVDGLSRMPLTAEQRSRLCSPSREPEAAISSAAPAAPKSTPPPP